MFVFRNLQKTLDDLKDYQRQQELWINYHQKLRSEQASPSVQLEQRLHYREFKIRQKLEDENYFKDQNNQPRQKVSNEESINMAALNQIQLKLEEHGKKLFDLFVELEEQEKAYEEIQFKKKTKETNEEIHERSNRIKKLLAATTGNNNELNDSSDQRQSKTVNNNKVANSPNTDETEGKDTKDDSGEGEECSPNSKPVLIPVTFVLPPSN